MHEHSGISAHGAHSTHPHNKRYTLNGCTTQHVSPQVTMYPGGATPLGAT